MSETDGREAGPDVAANADAGAEVETGDGGFDDAEAVSVEEEIDAELAELAAEDRDTPMERWTRIAFVVGWLVLGVLALTERDLLMAAGSACGVALAGAQLAVGHHTGLRLLVDRLIGWRLWRDLGNLAFLVLVLLLSLHNDVGPVLLTIVGVCCAASVGVAAFTLVRGRRHA